MIEVKTSDEVAKMLSDKLASRNSPPRRYSMEIGGDEVESLLADRAALVELLARVNMVRSRYVRSGVALDAVWFSVREAIEILEGR